MTTQSTCPNCQQLLAELERLRAQLEEARKRIAALEAEVRRGRRSAAPFLLSCEGLIRLGQALKGLACRRRFFENSFQLIILPESAPI